jgi:hypothetical protein
MSKGVGEILFDQIDRKQWGIQLLQHEGKRAVCTSFVRYAHGSTATPVGPGRCGRPAIVQRIQPRLSR